MDVDYTPREWSSGERRQGRGFRWLALLLFLFFLLIGGLLAKNYQHLGNLLRVLVLVKTQYLHPVGTGMLVDGAMQGIVDALDDPYSVYLDARTFKQLQEQIRGSFGGLGILVGLKNNQLTVVRTYENTPAFEKGIQPGDVIVKIDQHDARGMDLETAVQFMRGPVGSQVHLVINRPGLEKPLELTITRQEISVPTVQSRMLDREAGIGYLAIAQFTEKTADEVEQALQKLQKAGLKALVLDLRDNPGGELRAAVHVAGYFVPSGPVVYIQYRGGREDELKAEGQPLRLPLVVLVNGNSASAAEILAGAVKDRGTGRLVGEKTFGKGVVQTVFNLSDGAGLKLTTARYLTPGRHDINKKGIQPDIVVEQAPGAAVDRQLEKARQLLQEKLVRPAA